MEKIDILMATYNGEKYVAQQINSILEQTYTNFNLIISDDCSTDNTRKILEEYKQKDNRIQIFYQEKNLGYIKNFEFLLTKVTSDIYMLSDQDDIWLKEKIEKSYQRLVEEKADLVYTDLKVVDQELNEINTSFMRMMKFYKKAIKYTDYRSVYLYNTVTGCTIISKKEYIKNILPLPNESKFVVHDLWIALMTALNGKIVYMDESYIKYRQHGNNQIGANKTSDKMQSLAEIRELFIQVKKELFTAYCNNEEKFPDQLKKLNKKALNYFKMVETKKNINFRGWSVFFRLYKTENLKYFVLNFLIMNMPAIARVLFNIRKTIKSRRSKK